MGHGERITLLLAKVLADALILARVSLNWWERGLWVFVLAIYGAGLLHEVVVVSLAALRKRATIIPPPRHTNT